MAKQKINSPRPLQCRRPGRLLLNLALSLHDKDLCDRFVWVLLRFNLSGCWKSSVSVQIIRDDWQHWKATYLTHICKVTPTKLRFFSRGIWLPASLSPCLFGARWIKGAALSPATGRCSTQFSGLTLNRKKGTVQCHMCTMISSSEKQNAGAVCTWSLCAQISQLAYIYMHTHYVAHQCAGAVPVHRCTSQIQFCIFTYLIVTFTINPEWFSTNIPSR